MGKLLRSATERRNFFFKKNHASMFIIIRRAFHVFLKAKGRTIFKILLYFLNVHLMNLHKNKKIIERRPKSATLFDQLIFLLSAKFQHNQIQTAICSLSRS
jgi:hypothetical protein